MENPVLKIEEESTNVASTNLLELPDEFLILNVPKDVGNKKIATKHADSKHLQNKVYNIRVDSESVCRLCVKVFLSPEDLELHNQRVHANKVDTLSDQIIDDGSHTYYCNLCSFKSDMLSCYKIHMKSHSEQKLKVIAISKDASYIFRHGHKRFHCKLCKFKCFNQPAMILHLNKPHSDIHQCELCGKNFDNLATFANHKCSECDVTNSEPLAEQMDDCATDTIYYCSLCNCKFPIMSSWLKHPCIKCHFVEKPRPISILKNAQYEYKPENRRFQCKLCEFNCFGRSAIKQHVNGVHLKIKHYQCELCGKGFFNLASFQKHMRHRTGEKPYKCTECDYASSVSVSKHMKIHNAVRPFHCNVCEYKSPDPARLRVHMRTHTGEKPYKCLICDYAATHKVSLVNHMEKKHTNVA